MKLVKLHYFNLDAVELSALYEYFYTHYNPKPHKRKNAVDYNRVSIKNHSLSKNIYKDTVICIALKYLDMFGFKTAVMHEHNYLIEVCRYSCVTTDTKQLSEFDMHEDDGAIIDYTVNTVVFYLHKSPTIIGGDLLVEVNKKSTTIPIFSGAAVAFKGDLTHMPTPCFGEGLRDTIVVQLERMD